MPEIRVDSIVAKPGTKAHGYLCAVNRVDGSTLGFPVIIVAGKEDGPVLVADAGIHGDEPEGTLAIMAFARALDPQALRGAFIGVPVMNVGGFEAMSRGNPRDTHTFDMNRVYPGRPEGYLTERIAHAHHTHIGSIADMEISFHSGGNICYLAETIFVLANDAKSYELARAMGPDWPIVLETPHPVGSPLAAMAARGKPALTVELGGSAMCMPDALTGIVESLTRALFNVCRHYEMVDGKADYAKAHWRGRQKVVQAGQSGILEPIPEMHLKKPITTGQVLMRITDLFGNAIEELRAPCDGTLFGMRTYPSVTAGDWALFCADAKYVDG